MDSIFFLKNISRRLPKNLQVFLQKIWRLWSCHIVWDREMLQIIAKYMGLSINETVFLLRHGSRLNAFYWKYLQSRNAGLDFYATTPFYIFSLASWHMTNYERTFRANIINISKGDILDFGGGIGDLSLLLSKKGFSVTYADVHGEVFTFAEYLFAQKKASVKMIDLSKEKLTATYDTIICLDVIEHLYQQKETLDLLVSHLNQNGKLIITNLDFTTMTKDQEERHPMHVPLTFDARTYLLEKGLVALKDSWIFTKTT